MARLDPAPCPGFARLPHRSGPAHPGLRARDRPVCTGLRNEATIAEVTAALWRRSTRHATAQDRALDGADTWRIDPSAELFRRSIATPRRPYRRGDPVLEAQGEPDPIDGAVGRTLGTGRGRASSRSTPSTCGSHAILRDFDALAPGPSLASIHSGRMEPRGTRGAGSARLGPQEEALVESLRRRPLRSAGVWNARIASRRYGGRHAGPSLAPRCCSSSRSGMRPYCSPMTTTTVPRWVSICCRR